MPPIRRSRRSSIASTPGSKPRASVATHSPVKRRMSVSPRRAPSGGSARSSSPRTGRERRRRAMTRGSRARKPSSRSRRNAAGRGPAPSARPASTTPGCARRAPRTRRAPRAAKPKRATPRRNEAVADNARAARPLGLHPRLAARRADPGPGSRLPSSRLHLSSRARPRLPAGVERLPMLVGFLAAAAAQGGRQRAHALRLDVQAAFGADAVVAFVEPAERGLQLADFACVALHQRRAHVRTLDHYRFVGSIAHLASGGGEGLVGYQLAGELRAQLAEPRLEPRAEHAAGRRLRFDHGRHVGTPPLFASTLGRRDLVPLATRVPERRSGTPVASGRIGITPAWRISWQRSA